MPKGEGGRVATRSGAGVDAYKIQGQLPPRELPGECSVSDPALGGDSGVAICHETVPDSIGDPPISPSTPIRPIPGVPKLEK